MSVIAMQIQGTTPATCSQKHLSTDRGFTQALFSCLTLILKGLEDWKEAIFSGPLKILLQTLCSLMNIHFSVNVSLKHKFATCCESVPSGNPI